MQQHTLLCSTRAFIAHVNLACSLINASHCLFRTSSESAQDDGQHLTDSKALQGPNSSLQRMQMALEIANEEAQQAVQDARVAQCSEVEDWRQQVQQLQLQLSQEQAERAAAEQKFASLKDSSTEELRQVRESYNAHLAKWVGFHSETLKSTEALWKEEVAKVEAALQQEQQRHGAVVAKQAQELAEMEQAVLQREQRVCRAAVAKGAQEAAALNAKHAEEVRALRGALRKAEDRLHEQQNSHSRYASVHHATSSSSWKCLCLLSVKSSCLLSLLHPAEDLFLARTTAKHCSVICIACNTVAFASALPRGS